ncbi:MAG TPA: MerR family transcriptional regulator [Pseudonocardiaceae bacterium]|jgi:protein phosphatase|nr:MerR family transcriptional regulator [Pseudonocardiaceae bacterium]
MGLLTIGAFSRASRLSPKALRLYDELGLLRPAHVDPASGYRFYAPDQLEQARLVAWLRRLGMPLARIRTVCEAVAAEPAQAAAEVAAYWRQVEADTEARRNLVAFLIEHLSGKDSEMSGDMPDEADRSDEIGNLTIRFAVRSDRGLVRESNQDATYGGARLLAVADGFGASPDGTPASVVAIDALRPLDTAIPAGGLLNALEDAVRQADSAVRELDPSQTIGTTLTALLWSGSQLALVHIGDSRVYLLRDGELFTITHDHTWVQSLVDEGRLTSEEAASHPERAILVRALHGGGAEPDLRLRDAQPGDRYLLCSDGLHTVVPDDTLHDVLRTSPDPDEAVRRLVDLANDRGGPDNIACVVADVVVTAVRAEDAQDDGSGSDRHAGSSISEHPGAGTGC